MNEDGNTFAPHEPDFSSSNKPTDNEQPIARPIMSQPDNAAIRPTRFGFSNRRFDKKPEQQPIAFTGAPEFFNQTAVASAPEKHISSKIAIIGVISLVAIIGIIAIIISASGQNSATLAKEMTVEDAISISDFETDMTYLVERGDIEQLTQEEQFQSMKKGFDSYKKIQEKLKNAKNDNSEIGKKASSASEAMNNMVAKWQDLMMRYELLFNYVNHDNEEISNYSGDNKAIVKQFLDTYRKVMSDVELFNAKDCSDYMTDECAEIDSSININYKTITSNKNAIVKVALIDNDSLDLYRNNHVGSILIEIADAVSESK